MTTKDTTHYLPAEDYIKPIEVLHSFTELLLLSIAEHSPGLKGAIARNFVARGMSCLESILQVWHLANFQDCWTLHRSLVDRLFTLRRLSDRDEFEVFEKWSYVRQYDSKNRILNDPELNKKLKPEEQSFSEDEKKRYVQLKQEKISWTRPKAQQVAKEMNLTILYTLAFDYASAHVHPMANDGEADFLRLTKLASQPHSDQRVVLHNSLIIQVLLTQEGMRVNNLLWRGIVQDFLFNYIPLLETGSEEYLETYAKIVNLGPDFAWCEPSQNQ